MFKLSILILTTPRRVNTLFPSLLNSLLNQIGDRIDIEVLGLFDNKKRSIGEKRNNLLQIANGEYLVFIDDDDKISDDYIKSIMDAINNNPNTDCIVFDCYATFDKSWKVTIKYSKDFGYWHAGEIWTAKPSHTMVWKSSIAKKHLFKHISYKEEIDWIEEICKDIKIETRIDKVLYYYEHSGKISESAKPSKGEV